MSAANPTPTLSKHHPKPSHTTAPAPPPPPSAPEPIITTLPDPTKYSLFSNSEWPTGFQPLAPYGEKNAKAIATGEYDSLARNINADSKARLTEEKNALNREIERATKWRNSVNSGRFSRPGWFGRLAYYIDTLEIARDARTRLLRENFPSVLGHLRNVVGGRTL